MKISQISFFATVLISILAAMTSLLGVGDPRVYMYETANWALQAQGQDIGNLMAVVVLLTSMYHMARGSRKAYVVWVGSLMYFMYAFIAYAFFVHFNYLFLAYTAVLGFTFYTLFSTLKESNLRVSLSVDKHDFASRFASIVLILTGGLFALLWLGEIIPALLSGQVPTSLIETSLWVNPIQVIDLSVVLPGMILTGILLFQRKSGGYFYAAPWLTFSILMGSSIVATMIMMNSSGYPDTIPPMIMVGMIVLLSLGSLIYYLRHASIS